MDKLLAFYRMTFVLLWGGGGRWEGLYLKFFLTLLKTDSRPFKCTFRIIVSSLTKLVSWKEPLGFLIQLPPHPMPEFRLQAPQTNGPSASKDGFTAVCCI